MGEAEETNVGDTAMEPPVQTSEAFTEDRNAPIEAPVTTTEEIAETAGSTGQSEKGGETTSKPAEGESSHAGDANGGGERNGYKDDVPKGGEGELGLPMVATDITLVTCRAGEKVTGNSYLRWNGTKHVFVAETYYYEDTNL